MNANVKLNALLRSLRTYTLLAPKYMASKKRSTTWRAKSSPSRNEILSSNRKMRRQRSYAR